MKIETEDFIRDAESERNTLYLLNEIGGGIFDWTIAYPKIFAKVPIPPGTILDVGSNKTRFDKWLKGRSKGKKVVSFDIRKFARQEGEFVRGSAKSLPFADNSFDSVTSFHAIPLYTTKNVTEKDAIGEMLRVARRQVLIWPLPSNWIRGFVESSESGVTEKTREYLRGIIGDRKDVEINALHSRHIMADIGLRASWILRMDKI